MNFSTAHVEKFMGEEFMAEEFMAKEFIWLKSSRLKFPGLKLRVENLRVLMSCNPTTRLSEVRISFRIWKLSQSYSNY